MDTRTSVVRPFVPLGKLLANKATPEGLQPELARAQDERNKTVAHPELVEGETEQRIAEFKRMVLAPYQKVITRIADHYSLLDDNEYHVIHRVMHTDDQALLHHGMLLALYQVACFVLLQPPEQWHDTVYEKLAHSIIVTLEKRALSPVAAIDVMAVEREIPVDKQPHMPVLRSWPVVIGGALSGIATITAGLFLWRRQNVVDDKIDYQCELIREKIDGTTTIQNDALQKVVTHLDSLGKEHVKQRVVQQAEHAAVTRSINVLEDELFTTHESMHHQTNQLAQLVDAALDERDDTFHELHSSVQVLRRDCHQEKQRTAQKTAELDRAIKNNQEDTTRVKSTLLTKITEQEKRLATEQSRLSASLVDVAHQTSQNRVQSRDINKKIDAVSGRVDRVTRSVFDLAREHEENRPGTFKKITDGVKDAGDALHSVGRGISSVRRAFLPVEDIVHTIIH